MILRAFDPNDRWAFIQNGDDIILCRPPYRLNNRHDFVVSSETNLSRLVIRQGLISKDLFFETWEEIFSYVRNYRFI